MRQQDPDKAILAREQESARPTGGQLGDQVAEEAATQGQNASDPTADDDAWVGVHEQPTLTGSDVDGNRMEALQAPLALVVDDNRLSRDLCAARLIAMGCRVLTAENGLAGWRIARTTRPDVVILDISMPVMDGCELAQHIRADDHLAKVPLIAITAFGSCWQEAALACGCTSVLEKPTEFPEFERVVRAALAGPSSRGVGAGSSYR
jgi:two-component system cell cycle response regulator DivK